MNNEQTMKEELLKSALREFTEKGFHKASLREICQNVDLTTGFLYNHFKDKKHLFNSIVEELAADIDRKMDHIFDKYLDDSSKFSPVQKEMDIIRYLYNHRDVLILLFTRSEGTDYENYASEIYSKYEEEFIRFYRESMSDTEDCTFLSIICRMRYQSYYEILFRATSMDEAIELARKVGYFKSAGLMGMATYYQAQTRNS